MWAPKVHDRFLFSPPRNGRDAVFVVTCDADFDRKPGGRVFIDGKVWRVLGWDDHRTALSPSNGENIALGVAECLDGEEGGEEP